jgi:hypothetical protein
VRVKVNVEGGKRLRLAGCFCRVDSRHDNPAERVLGIFLRCWHCFVAQSKTLFSFSSRRRKNSSHHRRKEKKVAKLMKLSHSLSVLTLATFFFR